jgi:hypothetical protein
MARHSLRRCIPAIWIVSFSRCLHAVVGPWLKGADWCSVRRNTFTSRHGGRVERRLPLSNHQLVRRLGTLGATVVLAAAGLVATAPPSSATSDCSGTIDNGEVSGYDGGDSFGMVGIQDAQNTYTFSDGQCDTASTIEADYSSGNWLAWGLYGDGSPPQTQPNCVAYILQEDGAPFSNDVCYELPTGGPHTYELVNANEDGAWTFVWDGSAEDTIVPGFSIATYAYVVSRRHYAAESLHGNYMTVKDCDIFSTNGTSCTFNNATDLIERSNNTSGSGNVFHYCPIASNHGEVLATCP